MMDKSDSQQLLAYASKAGNDHILKSIDIIKSCLNQINYNCDNFCIGFNGGKDCTVLLNLLSILFREEMKKRSQIIDSNIFNSQIKVLFIVMQDTFPELDNFIDASVEKYFLKIVKVYGDCYKQALEKFKLSEDGSSVIYIFMGTRSSDSTTQVNPIQRTDQGWPNFIRVSPLFNWSYHQVWSYLLDLKVPYCSLYDQGYTSLGFKSKTKLNPKLKKKNEDGYLPAYLLDDEADERGSRLSK